MCVSSMAGEDGRRRQSRTTVAVILVLCSFAQSLTCFSLQGLFKKVDQDKVVNEATVMEVKDGSILFNGKNTDSQSGSASVAATENEGLLHIDLDQSDATGALEQTSQLESAIANEAAWRRLKPSLHCGQNQMKFKAMGPGADYLQLDMSNANHLPLSQVPETCSYSMKRNSLGLVLVVPYNGCNVIQENGNYMLPMSWLETPVKLTCPILKNYAAASTPKPAQQPWKLPFPHGPWSLNRRKRQANQPLSIYDPRSPYYPYLYYYNYYMNILTPAPAPSATTTAKPDMTTTTETMTTMSSTENPPTKPPAYPNLYYPYLYYLYYPYYYPLPNAPMTTTTPPATTTAKPTSGPATSGMTTTAKMTTTVSGSTTTASPTTTKTTQKPLNPYYPPYFPYPYYPPAGQLFPGMPDNSDIYYYQVVQHYYGKPPYPQITTIPMQPTQPPTPPTTTKPDGPTTTKPSDPTTTTKPSDPSPTTKPTTVSASTTACDKTTEGVCTTTKPSSGPYPGPMSPYVPYHQLPFVPYVSYKYNKAGKLPDDQIYIPQADYKSGLQARAHPPPHPGFNYWQPVPWFGHSTGQNNLQFAWKKIYSLNK